MEIGDGVEIGAASCVDRGKFGATITGDGGKIDNLVQISHNCKIGRSRVMAGQSGLAGSVTLGDGVVTGGRAMGSDQFTVGAIGDVLPGKTLPGIPAAEYRDTMRQRASLKHLPEIVQKIDKRKVQCPCHFL